MEHIAIMERSWDLTKKILLGDKIIESRLYEKEVPPWNLIQKEETIYFKEIGDLIKLKANVEKVVQYSNLTPLKIKKICDKYGHFCGFDNEEKQVFYEECKDKKFCILIFIKNPELVRPFEINNHEFEKESMWISVEDIKQIRCF